MSKLKAFLNHHTTNNKTACVIITAVILFVLNVSAVLLSLLIANNDWGFMKEIINLIFFIFLAPQMLSLMIPVPGTYLIILALEAYLIVILLHFLTKDKKEKN